MPPRKTSGNAAPAGTAVRIRMYNVGFGDCFLMFVPTEAGEKTILIDCGSIKKARHDMDEIVAAVIGDLARDGGRPHVDLLIATHRHKDHISGFADPRWREVSVGEVWMPWTEKPGDPDATRLRLLQDRFSKALERAIASRDMARRSALLDIVANARSNETALDMLHRGFHGRPPRHFLPRKDAMPALLQPSGLPGVDVHVLGPSHDETVLGQMSPARNEAYLAALEYDAASVDGDDATFDFGTSWAIMGDYASSFVPRHLRLTARDMKAVQRHAEDRDWELLAATADNAINNTSLIVMIRVGSAHLFFPGDAQWGPWQLLLGDAETSRLLRKTNFYKVGHHGSHNATPKRFFELWKEAGGPRSARWSMMSVTPDARYDDIPRGPLVDALASTVGHLVRSDAMSSARDVRRSGELWAEVAVPTQ